MLGDVALRQWTRDECDSAVRAWMADGGNGQRQSYVAWAKGRADVPSAEQLIYRRGKFATIVADLGFADRRPPSPARLDIDLDEVRRLYCDERLSVREVGERLGVSNTTTLRRLIDAGVELRRPGQPRRVEPDPDELRRLWDEGVRARDIAARLGITVRVARMRLAEIGLGSRPGPFRAELEDAAWLRARYPRLSPKAIAAEIDVNPETVRRALYRHGMWLGPRTKH